MSTNALILPENIYTPAVLKTSVQQLKRVMREVDPSGDIQLESEVEYILLHLLDDFVHRVTQSAVLCADHRGSKSLEVSDLQLALEMDHGIKVPGFNPRKKQKTKK
jgi:transcription initiation factor TFIID subunit TAF12